MSDFYLACAGVIPLLALALFVETNPEIVVMRVPTQAMVDGINRAQRPAKILGPLFYGALCAYAEFVCLRSLETHRSAPGGATMVWVTLGFLTVNIVGHPLFVALLGVGPGAERPDDSHGAPSGSDETPSGSPDAGPLDDADGRDDRPTGAVGGHPR